MRTLYTYDGEGKSITWKNEYYSSEEFNKEIEFGKLLQFFL